MQTIQFRDGTEITYLPRSDWDESGAPRLGHIIPRTQIKGLVGHHTVTLKPDQPGFDDERQHMEYLRTVRPDLGEDVPYNQCVFGQADPMKAIVAEGRGWDRTGAHTEGFNSSRWGVAAVGNFNHDEFTLGMIRAFRWIGTNLVVLEPVATRGHRDLKATACPGSNIYSEIPQLQPPFNHYEIIGESMATIEERLQELEAIALLNETPETLVHKVYLATIERAPDPNGFAYWVDYLDGGGSVTHMRRSFVASNEYKQLHGTTEGAL